MEEWDNNILVQVIFKHLKAMDADWQIGHFKIIFTRRELSEKLERLAKLQVDAAARTLGRFGREVAERRLASTQSSFGCDFVSPC